MENFDNLMNRGFVKVDNKNEQINIGKIEEFDDHVEVECEAGCSKVALNEAMIKIANETKKPVKSIYNGENILVEPKQKFDEFIGRGFVKVDDKNEQINIGKIEEFDDHFEVECEAGCSKVALNEVMKKIANETKKPVKSIYNGENILVESEK